MIPFSYFENLFDFVIFVGRSDWKLFGIELTAGIDGDDGGDGDERSTRKDKKYQDNPWASRIMYLDPIPEKEGMMKRSDDPHWVRPNHSVLVL